MPAIHVHIVAASDADCTQALNLVDNIIQCGAFNSVWRLAPVINEKRVKLTVSLSVCVTVLYVTMLFGVSTKCCIEVMPLSVLG